jgi:hypothetical protein
MIDRHLKEDMHDKDEIQLLEVPILLPCQYLWLELKRIYKKIAKLEYTKKKIETVKHNED